MKFNYIFIIVIMLLGALCPVGNTSALSYNGLGALHSPTTPILQTSDGDVINFYQIRESDIQLIGPYDSEILTFGIPAEWKLTNSPTLQLDLTVSVNALFGLDYNGQVNAYGGTLIVEYNREPAGTFTLNQNGTTQINIQIPLAFTKSVRDDGRQEISFALDSGVSCLVNQQMSVTIKTSSNLIFPHENIQPEIDLTRFPFPIYQGSINPDDAIVVVPRNPTAEELQSVMIVSAGLGKLTGSRLSLDLKIIDSLSDEQKAAHNLIFVGRAGSLPILSQLDIPMKILGGNFDAPEGSNTDGIIQMIPSPWSFGHVVLIVSGDTDAGVLKAAKAISTGIIRPNKTPDLAIVQSVLEENQQKSVKLTDLTLEDLGYETELLERQGVDSATFTFYIPPDLSLSPDSYFELYFGNSALLDYARSGLVVQINGHPIGSVRFTDVTAAETQNRLEIKIPDSIVVPGNNILEIVSNLHTIDNCSSPNLRGAWAAIWSNSRLHIPLTPTIVKTSSISNLSQFPAPFIFDSTLNTTAFILQKNNPESWASALKVAEYLGDRSNGSIALLKTYFVDEIPDIPLSDMDFIIMGLAPDMPILTKINEQLPAPFETTTGIASENSLQVGFRIPKDSPVGYVQLIPSPWSPDNIVILAVGNLQQGTTWAISSLYTSSLRSQLAGNLVVVNDQQITTTDTRISVPNPESFPTKDLGLDIVLPEIDQNSSSKIVERPTWIPPVLIAILGVILLVLVLVILNAYRQNRTSHNSNL